MSLLPEHAVHEGDEDLQPLQTISENEGVTVDHQSGDDPTSCPKLTNRIASANESFLYSSLASLPTTGSENGRKRASTMQNLYDKSSFLNLTSDAQLTKIIQKALFYIRDDVTFGSTAGLNVALADQSSPKPPEEGTYCAETLISLKYARNLLVVSLSVTLMFIALGSVRNLQSSMNHEAGIGLISMAVSFVGYMLGSVFSSSFVQILHPKCCLIGGLVPQFLYIAANLHPTMWLMVPVSLAQGTALALLWNAMSTYVTLLARGKAHLMEENFSAVSSRYFGFFGLFFQSYFVIGNLISSLILSGSDFQHRSETGEYGNYSLTNITQNVTLTQNAIMSKEPLVISDHSHLHLCGANFWQHYDLGGGAYDIEDRTKFLLLGIYMGFVLASILVAACCLEQLNPLLFKSSHDSVTKIKLQLLSLKTFCTNRNFILLFPIMMFSFMEIGFITAEFTKAYVTCALGIHMVGYTMICFGICGCFSSYLSGFINKFVSFRPLIITAALLNIAVLIHMLVWKPAPDELWLFFLDLGLWGVSDGIWVCQVNSLLSVVFPHNYEEAFTGLRVAQGFGVALVFACSGFLGMSTKIYITGSFCAFSVLAYLVMDVMRDKEIRKNVALLRETSI